MTGTGAFIRPEVKVFAALRSLVDNRVYPNVFPQNANKPIWPAIRYTRVATVPVQSLCGDGGDETADVTIQLDVVTANWSDLVSVRDAVMTAMHAITDPQPVWDSEFTTYDMETRTHRCVLSYLFYPSSESGL